MPISIENLMVNYNIVAISSSITFPGYALLNLCLLMYLSR